MTGTIDLEDDDGEEESVTVALKYEVCPTCEGRGKHVNPSIDCNGLTAEDFAEDPDFREEYMSGRYDVACYECKGKRVVLDLDRDNVDSAVLARINMMLKEREDDERERAAERRMGA
jgi:predicted methyltransferase